MIDYRRLEGESDDELILRVCEDKPILGSWQTVTDILNHILGVNYNESTYRKRYAAFKQMFEANRSKFSNIENELERIREEERRLEIEKIKFRDERNAWAQQNRVQARAEAKLDNIEDALSDFGRIYFPVKVTNNKLGEKTLLVMLSDLHIGATFDNYWGSYNSDIARARLGQLLEEIKVIAKRHDCGYCYVICLGDEISGGIHFNIRVTDRENVVQQIKMASQFISSFCYELTKIFTDVTMISVAGNHSRLGKKEESLVDERADDLVAWIVSQSLSHVPNFQYLEEANIDNTVAMFSINDRWYFACHGDYDEFSKSGLQNLITMVHAIPVACLFGHKHFCALSEVNGIKMVQGGTLAGTGDDFTIQKRLGGKPSQMVCVCSEAGIESYYPIELD